MHRSLLLTGLGAAATLPAAPLFAQADDPATAAGHAGDDSDQVIVVTGRRGAAKVEPEVELGPEEIDAYGMSTIGEVLGALRDDMFEDEQTEILINGQRVANPGIYGRFPTDALERVEVLKREAGEVYAQDTEVRVVNVVVKEHFIAWYATVDAKAPSAGGTSELGGGVNAHQLSEMHVNTYHLTVNNQSILLASERPDYLAEFPDRAATSLRPRKRSVAASIEHQRPVGEWSVNASAAASASDSLTSLRRSDAIVKTRTAERSLSSTLRLKGAVGDWGITANVDAAYGQASQSGPIASDSESASLGGRIGIDHIPFSMPAGKAQLNLSASGSHSRSTTVQDPYDSETATGRFSSTSSRWTMGGRLRLPLFDEGAGGLALGNPGKVNLSLAADLSGSSSGGGRGAQIMLNWTPRKIVNLIGRWALDYQVPSNDQLTTEQRLGSPLVVYDFATGQSVQVDTILGGNPDLRAPRQETWALDASVRPGGRWYVLAKIGLRGSTSKNEIGTIADVTPELEAAFPDRFIRDALGQLVAIDRRPLNFSSSETLTLNGRISFRVPLGGGRRRSLQFSLGHTEHLQDRTRYRAALPESDRLAGDGGGKSARSSQLTANFNSPPGWSLKASLVWQSDYRIRQLGGIDGDGDLLVAPPLIVNLGFRHRFRATVEPEGGKGRPRQITRLELGFDIANVLDSRRSATLADGRPAPGYDRATADPIGRSASLSLKYRF